jgi:beta-lactamase class A
MADLLARIASGGAASAASTAELHRWLRATRTGPMRLRAGLPTGVELLHKTGTCVRDGASVVVADVGFVPLDAGARIVLAAYVGDAKGPVEVQEAALASVARAAYAAFGPGQRPTSSPTAP